MASSAPQSPARQGGTSYFDTSPDRPSPSKLLRINQLFMDRATSLPPRRLSSPSPAKKAPNIRPRLTQYYTMDHAVSLLQNATNIITLTGAGISTSLGVPDFRSANGVYSLLGDSIYNDPQELFQIDNFKTNPEEYFKQVAKVLPKMQGRVLSSGVPAPVVPKYSPTHAFIAMLEAKGKLLTDYTQNIDGLEIVAGISPARLVQCHGTLATATCMSCGKRTTARKYMPIVQAGGVPYCKCSLENGGPKPKQNRQRGRTGKKKRKRDEYEDTDSEDASGRFDFPKGLLKPDMTFFGEDIPDVYAPRLRLDKSKVDLLVIIGTSLAVEPVNEMLLHIPPTVPQIWISRDRCQREGVKVDIELLGDCDLVLGEIARRAGWEGALNDRLWTSDRSFEMKPTAMKAPGLSSKQRPPKQENRSASPVKPKPGRPLQIRQKSGESSNDITKSATDIIIKINDEVLSSAKDADSKRKAKQATELPAVVLISQTVEKASSLVEEKTLDTEIIACGKQLVETNVVKIPSPPKVTIELEEGTRNRWYVRRAK